MLQLLQQVEQVVRGEVSIDEGAGVVKVGSGLRSDGPRDVEATHGDDGAVRLREALQCGRERGGNVAEVAPESDCAAGHVCLPVDCGLNLILIT